MQFLGHRLVQVLTIAVLLLSSFTWSASIANDNGFMDSVSTGFRFASKLLGMNQASSVATLVSQAFGGGGPTKTSNAPKLADKQSQNYQYEDSEYSSNDKDNYVVTTSESDSKSDSYPSQFNNIVDELRQPSGTTSSTTSTTSSPAASLSGISSLLRVLGMDEKKLSALMVNGLIFIAQMVKNGASYIDQKLTPVRLALQRLIVRLPGSNTVTFAKE